MSGIGTAPISAGALGLIKEALAEGDLFAVIQMLGFEQAKTLESTCKNKVATIEQKNAEVQRLNGIIAQLGVEDKDGQVITGDSGNAKDMAKYFADNPEVFNKVHSGINFYDAAGNSVHPVNASNYSSVTSVKAEHHDGSKLETVRTVLDAEVKKLTSNDQLMMLDLQGYTQKYNTSLEMCSGNVKKEGEINGSIVRNMNS